VLAEGLARLAGAGRPSCIEVGLAALLHDAGKLFWTPDLRARDLRSDDEEELELILDHPAEGLAALLSSPQLPALTFIVAFEHHLGFNGTGFPRLQRPRRPHAASRLVRVADAFDTLHTAWAARPHASRQSPLAWLAERSGTQLDPIWVNALTALATAAPAGL
ncbi:MAG: HD domain-containing phosphohydrolase, partial [Acidobacteriota bacterium]